MNGLRNGWSSPAYNNLWLALLEAPPGAVEETARAVLTPEQAAHPKFAELVEIFRQVEIEVATQTRGLFGRAKTWTPRASATPSKAENPQKTIADEKLITPQG
jgi:hypothetical protein